jgi:outer membrane protein OmpA-like peptidoglycan-associated protein
MPGGFGGTDLYRCIYQNGEWGEPENLGETINTKGNEVYPYIAPNGDLFFASDGHEGLGKKDLFLSRLNDLHWIEPVHLHAPINSRDDDFGLITNGEFSEGFFSSNRGRSDDIYEFSTLIPQLFNCDTLLENQYCYEFWDDMYPGMDSLPVNYEWEFSDGTKIRGIKVVHCLPGAGKYWARLNIIDNSTSSTFFTQTSMEFELEDHIQPYITSRDAGIVNNLLAFDGLSSYLPGYTIEEYIWDFDDGTFLSGAETEHQFAKTGMYGVKLGVKGHAEGSNGTETRCVIKPVTIVRDNQALAMFMAGIESPEMAESTAVERDTSEASQDFSVYDVNPEEEVFRVEVLASQEKLQLEDTIFDPLREDYEIKEFYLADDSLYSYAVGEYASLLETYGVYGEVVEKGFTSAKVKTYMLAELPTEVIAKINRDFAELADANFEFNKTEVSENSYHILDKVVKIMKENPDLAMEIAAHTDNIGSFEFNMELSQRRAQSIVDYLVSNGIDKIRLLGKGYGESRPIETNSTEEGRMMNRRVEFIILNK